MENALSTFLADTTLTQNLVLHPVTFELLVDAKPDFDVSWIDFNQAVAKGVSLTILDSLIFEVQDLGWDLCPFGQDVKSLKLTREGPFDEETDAFLSNLEIKLDLSEFTWTARNETGITLRDITHAIYRLMVFKYDWHTERFTGWTVTRREGDGIELACKFHCDSDSESESESEEE